MVNGHNSVVIIVMSKTSEMLPFAISVRADVDIPAGIAVSISIGIAIVGYISFVIKYKIIGIIIISMNVMYVIRFGFFMWPNVSFMSIFR